MNPDDRQYTAEHEWVLRVSDAVIRFGITDFAQDALGDIVFVSLPDVDQQIVAGEPCGEVESTKSVSDVFAPASGTVVARNEALIEEPGAINSDPYGSGWLVEVSVAGTADDGDDGGAGLMDAERYESHLASL